MVKIHDDRRHESTEQFRLVLGSPMSEDLGRAVIGVNNVTVVSIEDDGDREYCYSSHSMNTKFSWS